MNDIELDLKNRLREANDDALVASAAEVRALLDRCNDYRERLRKKKHEWDVKAGALQSEIADHRQTLAWARKRLDPEGKNTGYSVLDQYETALLIGEIERRRGRIVASRMLYGSPMNEGLAQETLGALKHAIEEARSAEAQWRKYLAESYAKNRAGA
jgi:hypothetical protein